MLPFSASADLYRWVDPQTGSVKFSSYPPPWYGDPERERGAPSVELIRPGAGSQPAKPPVSAAIAPAKPVAAAVPLADLEANWQALLQHFASLPPGTDIVRASALKPQVERFEAMRAELDRRDPAGAERRNALAQRMLEQQLRSPR